MDFTQVIYDTQAGSSALVAGLGVYAGAPCIFTSRTVPAMAPRPYTWSPGDVANEPFESKDLRGRVIERDIWVVCDDNGNEDEVESLARVLLGLFHRAVLDMGSGNTNYITEASGPRVGPTADKSAVTARIVTVRATYQGD